MGERRDTRQTPAWEAIDFKEFLGIPGKVFRIPVVIQPWNLKKLHGNSKKMDPEITRNFQNFQEFPKKDFDLQIANNFHKSIPAGLLPGMMFLVDLIWLEKPSYVVCCTYCGHCGHGLGTALRA